MALALALAPAVPAAAAKDEASGAVAEKIATATEEVAYVNLDKARGLFAAARAMTKPGIFCRSPERTPKMPDGSSPSWSSDRPTARPRRVP
jgi:hypothetical protein